MSESSYQNSEGEEASGKVGEISPQATSQTRTGQSGTESPTQAAFKDLASYIKI